MHPTSDFFFSCPCFIVCVVCLDSGIVIASDVKPKGQPFQFSKIPHSWTECWPYLVIYVKPQVQVYDRMNQSDTSLQSGASLQNIQIEQGLPNAAVIFAHDSTTDPGKDVAVIAAGRQRNKELESLPSPLERERE